MVSYYKTLSITGVWGGGGGDLREIPEFLTLNHFIPWGQILVVFFSFFFHSFLPPIIDRLWFVPHII